MWRNISVVSLSLIIICVILELVIPDKYKVINIALYLIGAGYVFYSISALRKKELSKAAEILNLNLKNESELLSSIAQLSEADREKRIKINYYENRIKEIVDTVKIDNDGLADIESVIESVKKIVIIQEEEIKRNLDESENYQKELTASYNNLLAKSTEIEYSNMMLEKRVAKLSALNAVGKAVLSELEMEKIISTILDSYIVLISAKKIVLYLFEKEILVQKAMRGIVNFSETIRGDKNDISGGKESRYYEEYLKKAVSIMEENEIVIISELKVKGKELGVLFIVEEKENGNEVKKEELEMISALNIYASIALNNARVYKQLADKQRLEKEIGIARDIQMNLLPKDIKSVFGLEIANHFEPAKEVGGDYYDYFISAEGKFGIAIGDVSGKGMPAALLMTTIRAILRTIASYDLLPDIVMTRLNNVIFQDINEEMFVTLFYSLYDYETSTMFFSNAGHNPLIIYDSKEEKVIERTVKGTAIGFADNYNYRLDKIKLSYNDVIVFYTDGITEAENEKGELFGIERLKKCIEEFKELSSEKIKKGILSRVDEFRGGYEQVDDITLVVLKYKGWI